MIKLYYIIFAEEAVFGGFRVFPSSSAVNISYPDAAKIFHRTEQPILSVEYRNVGYAVKLPSLTGDIFVMKKLDTAQGIHEHATRSEDFGDRNATTVGRKQLLDL